MSFPPALSASYPPQKPPVPDIQALVARANFLKKNPNEQRTPNELDSLVKYITNVAQHNRERAHNQHPPFTNGHPVLNGVSTNGSTLNSSSYPPPSHSPVHFTQAQADVLRAQVQAFKFISRGAPIPEQYHSSLKLHREAVGDLDRFLPAVVQPAPSIEPSSVDIKQPATETRQSDTSAPGTQPEPALLNTGSDSLPQSTSVFSYNAYRQPLSLIQAPTSPNGVEHATRIRRIHIPSLMPSGLDPRVIFEQRDRFIASRMQQRISELESDSSPRALIELRSLRLLDKQRALRASVVNHFSQEVVLPTDRGDFKRRRRPTIQDARTTEKLERQQRVDRELSARRKHVDQLAIVCTHGKELISANRGAQDRIGRLGKAILNFHAQAEKEEQKRIERLAKERLKALRADDEEAYMKLIDTAKDTRITHLLRQTDSYLDSLAQAVVAQQREGGLVYNNDMDFETEDGPTNEATFGAQVDPDSVQQDKSKVDYYSVAHRISEKVVKQPSILIGGTLKEYQVKGLQWMVSLYNNKLDGILADEMGLGKTIQTISLITFLIEVKRRQGPYLVIVPLSTMTNWSGEFAKWAPSVKTVTYKGNPTQRRALQSELRVGHFQVLLTTFEYIIKDRPILSKLKWIYMIIDEGHRMKNTQSKLSMTLTTYYHSQYRLLLTGTPLQNNLPELWSLLNFVLPKIFNSVKSFDEWFNTPFASAGTGDKIELDEEEALLIIRRLHKVLRPFLLRRLKKDVEKDLPDKMEKVIKVRMSALQSQLYKQMKKHKMIADGMDSRGKGGTVRGLSNELMQLRKICQHPFLFDSVEERMNPAGMSDEKLIRTSGKIELLSRILPKFFQTGHRVLLFFQMTKVMDIMEDFLRMMGWHYLRLDGGTKTEDRAEYVKLFNAPDSIYKVFILSTRAGGLGLNLQTADTVIIFDSDWNPHADLQAQDRAHRIGQTKAVLILRFITEKSVEEAMYSRARFKLDIDDKVIQAGKFDNKSSAEEQEKFLRSILEADQEEDTEEAGDMNDDELNAIIKRTDEEETIFHEMDLQRERDALEQWRTAGNRGKPPQPLMQLEELPDCYKNDMPFEVTEVEELLEGRGQRRRNVVSYNDGLSDDAWAMALEEGEDIADMQESMKEKRNRRAAQKLFKDSQGTPASDVETKGRRGRKPGKAKAANLDYDAVTSAKRKRGVKPMSVASSLNDDDDDDRDQKRRRTKQSDLPPAIRDKMKKAFAECHRAVLACEDETGRKRCELFRDLPDRRDYPDYYQLITQPIALSQLKKRANMNHYKDVQAFRNDFRLMFNNARTYNQEGSWVYMDAVEMEKVFDATFERVIAGSGLPGVAGSEDGPANYESALTPLDDEERPRPPPAGRRGSGRKAVISDDEYLSDDD